MATELTPIVFWGQKNDHISLKVDLRDVTVCAFIAALVVDVARLGKI